MSLDDTGWLVHLSEGYDRLRLAARSVRACAATCRFIWPLLRAGAGAPQHELTMGMLPGFGVAKAAMDWASRVTH